MHKVHFLTLCRIVKGVNIMSGSELCILLFDVGISGRLHRGKHFGDR